MEVVNGNIPNSHEGRTCFDIVQFMEIGKIKKSPGNIFNPDGKRINTSGEPYFGVRQLGLRCATKEEAEEICTGIVQPGQEAAFIIVPVFIVMSKEKWSQIDEKNKIEDEGSNNQN